MAELATLARRRYERARLRRALRYLPLAVVVGVGWWAVGVSVPLTCFVAVALGALGVLALFYGRGLGPGAVAGTVLGLLPVLAFGATRLLGGHGSPFCASCIFAQPTLPIVCGAVAGAAFGLFAPPGRWAALGVAAAFAAASAACLCWWPIAALSVAALVGGACFTAIPLMIWRERAYS